MHSFESCNEINSALLSAFCVFWTQSAAGLRRSRRLRAAIGCQASDRHALCRYQSTSTLTSGQLPLLSPLIPNCPHQQLLQCWPHWRHTSPPPPTLSHVLMMSHPPPSPLHGRSLIIMKSTLSIPVGREAKRVSPKCQKGGAGGGGGGGWGERGVCEQLR